MKMKAKTTQKKPTLIQIVDDILVDVVWGKLSKRYFPDQSVGWFYDKLRGVDGNGGKGGFTPSEKEHLRNALFDLSERVRNVAHSIDT